MKIFALLFALISLTPGVKAQSTGADVVQPPEQLKLLLELQDLPGRDSPDSVWEVSYQWRIADRKAFEEWSMNGEDPAKESNVGELLSKQSFQRRNLSSLENRQIRISVPLTGDLLERLSGSEQRNQIVWLQALVRISNPKLNIDVVSKVNPVWPWPRFKDGSTYVYMRLSPQRVFSFTSRPPGDAGGQGKQVIVKPGRP
jgi:hypothetical protein